MNGFWDNDRTGKLRALIETEGVTFSVAAKELGCTRDAAIGRANRLGFKKQNATGVHAERHNVIDWAAELKVRRDRERRSKKIFPAEKPAIVIHAKRDARGKLYTLESIPSDACRWPFGDPLESTFHFCAHAIEPGTSYCQIHNLLGTNPAGRKNPVAWHLRAVTL